MRILKTFTPKITQLPITGRNVPYTFHIGVQLEVYAEIDDILHVASTVQVTTEHTYNVMIARYLNIAEDDNAVIGTRIARAMGENFDRNVHHKMVPVHGIHRMSESGTVYISQVLYSASTAADPGDKLKVDYAQMDIVIYEKKDQNECN